MSVLASGCITMKMKKRVPGRIIHIVEEDFGSFDHNGLEYNIDFDGNWRLDSVIDSLEPLELYIESGSINYWSDEGDARAAFVNGWWAEEYEQKFYMSDLPDSDISSTKHVAQILNIIANQLMEGSDSSEAVRVLLHGCKLTEKEIHLYGLDWLKDLDTEEE